MYVYKKYSKIFNECKAQASRNFSEYLYQFIYTNITMNLKLFSNMHEFFFNYLSRETSSSDLCRWFIYCGDLHYSSTLDFQGELKGFYIVLFKCLNNEISKCTWKL